MFLKGGGGIMLLFHFQLNSWDTKQYNKVCNGLSGTVSKATGYLCVIVQFSWMIMFGDLYYKSVHHVWLSVEVLCKDRAGGGVAVAHSQPLLRKPGQAGSGSSSLITISCPPHWRTHHTHALPSLLTLNQEQISSSHTHQSAPTNPTGFSPSLLFRWMPVLSDSTSSVVKQGKAWVLNCALVIYLSVRWPHTFTYVLSKIKYGRSNSIPWTNRLYSKPKLIQPTPTTLKIEMEKAL